MAVTFHDPSPEIDVARDQIEAVDPVLTAEYLNRGTPNVTLCVERDVILVSLIEGGNRSRLPP